MEDLTLQLILKEPWEKWMSQKEGKDSSISMHTFITIRYLFCFFKLIYLFLAALGLRCCTRAFSSGEWGLLFVVMRGLLTAVASLVAEHGL